MRTTDGTWIAWGDGDADRSVSDEKGRVRVPPDDPSYTLRRLWLTERDVERYYAGYSNQVLWPVCHGANWTVEHAEAYFDRYRDVNERFAEAVVDTSDEGTTVWFQDYHLALAPRRVKEERDAFCMQFWHIPWPSWDGFRRLPQRTELLDGLLANDLLGFHLPSYADRFLDCAAGALDVTVDRDAREVEYRGETTTLGAFPLGIDAERHHERALTVGEGFWESFRTEHGIGPDQQVAVGGRPPRLHEGDPRAAGRARAALRALPGAPRPAHLRPEGGGEPDLDPRLPAPRAESAGRGRPDQPPVRDRAVETDRTRRGLPRRLRTRRALPPRRLRAREPAL